MTTSIYSSDLPVQPMNDDWMQEMTRKTEHLEHNQEKRESAIESYSALRYRGVNPALKAYLGLDQLVRHAGANHLTDFQDAEYVADMSTAVQQVPRVSTTVDNGKSTQQMILNFCPIEKAQEKRFKHLQEHEARIRRDEVRAQRRRHAIVTGSALVVGAVIGFGVAKVLKK